MLSYTVITADTTLFVLIVYVPIIQFARVIRSIGVNFHLILETAPFKTFNLFLCCINHLQIIRTSYNIIILKTGLRDLENIMPISAFRQYATAVVGYAYNTAYITEIFIQRRINRNTA